MKSLTENDISDYRINGYLIKRSVFDRKEISNIAKWIDEYQNRKADDWLEKENAYYETSLLDKNTRILSRVEKFLNKRKNIDLYINRKNFRRINDAKHTTRKNCRDKRCGKINEDWREISRDKRRRVTSY